MSLKSSRADGLPSERREKIIVILFGFPVNLILKTTRSHYGDTTWSDYDYVVFADGHVIGRIMLHPQVPPGRPWFWTITAMDYPMTIHSRGYSETREGAMADFKAQWLDAKA